MAQSGRREAGGGRREETRDAGRVARLGIPGIALVVVALATAGFTRGADSARDAGAVARVARPASRAAEAVARVARPASRAPLLTICRLHYDGGGDWYANPSSLPNLLEAIRERTSLRVAKQEVDVRLTDDRLFDCAFLHATGHGNIHFSDEEIARLREYLERGGFFHADDNYGMDASFRREIKRVFPDRPLVDVPLSHPIYHIVYDFPKGIPKIHVHDGLPARGFGIFLGDRLAVYYSFSSDLGNGWEDYEVYHDPPALHEAALRMGVNLFVYAVTSRPVP